MSSDTPTVVDRTQTVVGAAIVLGSTLIEFARSVAAGEPHRLAHERYNIFQLELDLNEARMALLDAETCSRGAPSGSTGNCFPLDPPSVIRAQR